MIFILKWITLFTQLVNFKWIFKLQDLKDKKSIQTHDLVELSKMYLDKVSNLFGNHASQSISGELAAFIGYALAFPSDFLVLVDTYNVLK